MWVAGLEGGVVVVEQVTGERGQRCPLLGLVQPTAAGVVAGAAANRNPSTGRTTDDIW